MKTLYCHPLVVSKGGRFISPPGEEIDGLPLATWDDLKSHIYANFRLKSGLIELNGNAFYGDVWVPRDALNDYAYLVGDFEGNPEGQIEEAAPINLAKFVNEIEIYATNLWRNIGYSEALAPDECSHIPTEFIRPEFEWLKLEQDAVKEEKRYSIEEVSSRHRIVILGAPGAGKTSSVRWLAIQKATEVAKKPENGKVPLYFRLATLHRETSLRQALTSEADRIGAPWLASHLYPLAELGHIQFILDGLDEVPDTSRDKIFEELRDLSSSFPLAAMMVTCRPVVYSSIAPEFVHFQIRPFTYSQIAEWTFRRLFDKPERSWKAFVSYVFSNKSLLDMVSNPLLLNIATHVYTRQNTLPSSQTVLLQTWLDALLNQWDHVRAVNRSTEYWASPGRRYNALCRVAFHTCDREISSFRENEYLLWEESHVDGQHARETLHSLETHCGVVQRSKEKEWHFLHQVLLEHCAAAFMVEGSEDLTNKFESRIHKPLWQNIWMQACALSQDSTELILMVLDHENISEGQKFQLLFKAFTQPIRCERSVLDRCAHRAATLLRQLSSPFTFKVSFSERKYEAKLNAPQDSDTHKSLNPIQDLMRISASIYASRRSQLTKSLFSVISPSPIFSVLENACNIDGEFSSTIKNEHSGVIRIDKPALIEYWDTKVDSPISPDDE